MHWRRFIPLITVALLAVLLFAGLALDPKIVPSALIDKPVPPFDLPPLPGKEPGLIAANLARGGISLVNVWASWCGPCRIEHPQLMEIAKIGKLHMIGLNYKDDPANALAFLKQLGDPYETVGADRKGRIAIEWGVYGVPETFLIDGRGHIVMKHVGPLRPEDIPEKILPAIKAATP
ncbi:MAG: DsbE family thiol:disulfide interchange protein [Alphaproteobacteria bacterium]|nr:DsbE family thiol:disulfide interchange protein [Alphaproteobacteria bacterium]